MFVIEDERHAEPQDGAFESFHDAFAELKRRAALPWNESPNGAPCTNWRQCGRSYVIIECDDVPGRELNRVPVLEVDAAGCRWLIDIEGPYAPPSRP